VNFSNSNKIFGLYRGNKLEKQNKKNREFVKRTQISAKRNNCYKRKIIGGDCEWRKKMKGKG